MGKQESSSAESKVRAKLSLVRSPDPPSPDSLNAIQLIVLLDAYTALTDDDHHIVSWRSVQGICPTVH